MSVHGAIQALHDRTAMSDKSPRQAMSKKSGASLKEKREAKRNKSDAASQAISAVEKVVSKKKK
ncbi:conserved hypothetical protein [Nocardioides sp. AX2bis]|nr:conserved hypothetical protein [Nocardioides sp. AX2bis]